jgi:hypothetical protein
MGENITLDPINSLLSIYEYTYLNIGLVVFILLYLIHYLLLFYQDKAFSYVEIFINIILFGLWFFSSILFTNYILYYN